ncbi:MAG TPA: glycosyltransferase family 4 protein [Candidatus Sulfotelmatobacter sp.]|jgi:glycosyltransferase involved in cell wall biosynthesis
MKSSINEIAIHLQTREVMKHQPISVLHFTNATARAGAEEHILTLLRGLDRQQFRLSLVCDPEIAELMRPDVPKDVELIPLTFRRLRDGAAAFRLRQILRSRRVDVLHSHLFWSSLFASPVGHFCGVPVVIETTHVREVWRKGWKANFAIDRAVGRCVDRYVAVSEANGRYLIQEKGLPAGKVKVIRNGSDIRRFDPEYKPGVALKTNLGLAESDPLVVVVARLEPQKGHRVLLNSMPAILAEFPNARLVCVGEGVLRAELAGQARALGLEQNVRFVGAQNNVQDWLALGQMSVLPSFYEGLPLVAIESLAAGVPVVATDVDGTPEIVVHGKTGLTVPPNNSTALAQAICLLLHSPELRRQFGAAGRQWVLQEFTEAQQIRRTAELYRQTYSRKTGRSTLHESRPETSSTAV